MKKRVYIADSYSLNSGDLGILAATVENLITNDIEFIIENSHPHRLKKMTGWNYKIFPRAFDISYLVGNSPGLFKFLRAIISGIYDSLSMIIAAILYRMGLPHKWQLRSIRKKHIDAIINSDVWLSSGGGFLSSDYNYGFRLYGYLLANILQKPVIVFAQSIGPFNNKADGWLIRKFLNRAKLISVRDTQTYKYLLEQGFNKKFYLTADIALLLKSKRVNTQKFVAICIKKNEEHYHTAILKIIDYLISSKFKVVIVSHTPNDDQTAVDLFKHFDSDNVSLKLFGIPPKSLKELYSKCSFIVSSRMHAIIFASSFQVPWIGISYDPKFIGLAGQVPSRGIVITESQLSYRKLKNALKKMYDLEPYTQSELNAIRKSARLNFKLLKKVLKEI